MVYFIFEVYEREEVLNIMSLIVFSDGYSKFIWVLNVDYLLWFKFYFLNILFRIVIVSFLEVVF